MTGQQTDFLNEFWMTIDKPERKQAEPTNSKLRFYAILTTETHLDRQTIKEWLTHIVCTFPTRTICGAARSESTGSRTAPATRHPQRPDRKAGTHRQPLLELLRVQEQHPTPN